MTTTETALDADESIASEANQVRTMAIATVVCIVLAFLIVAGSLYAFYQDVPMAVAVGLFCGFWGGGGFGVVLGTAVHSLRVEALAKATKAAAAVD